MSEPWWAVGQFTTDSTCLHVNWNVYGEGDCNGLDGTHDDWFDMVRSANDACSSLCAGSSTGLGKDRHSNSERGYAMVVLLVSLSVMAVR